MKPVRPVLGRGYGLLKRLQDLRVSAAAPEMLTASISQLHARPSPSLPETPPSSPVENPVHRPLVADAPAETESEPETETTPSPETKREKVVRRGSAGSAVELAANFVRVGQADGRGLHEYVVTMDPAVDEVK
jgi:hypothetical protein